MLDVRDHALVEEVRTHHGLCRSKQGDGSSRKLEALIHTIVLDLELLNTEHANFLISVSCLL
jgi:hypothetical protein